MYDVSWISRGPYSLYHPNGHVIFACSSASFRAGGSKDSACQTFEGKVVMNITAEKLEQTWKHPPKNCIFWLPHKENRKMDLGGSIFGDFAPTLSFWMDWNIIFLIPKQLLVGFLSTHNSWFSSRISPLALLRPSTSLQPREGCCWCQNG